MSDLVLDSSDEGILGVDWVGIYPTLNYEGASGGTGIVEIYYYNSDPAPPISLTVRGVEEKFIINSLNIDNTIGTRGIASFKIWDEYCITKTNSGTGDFWNGSGHLIRCYDNLPSVGDIIHFTGPVPPGVSSVYHYYVTWVTTGGSYEGNFKFSETKGGLTVDWDIEEALLTSWDIYQTYTFSIGENIEVNVEGSIVWSGVINQINKTLPTSSGILYNLKGISWNYAMDKRRVVASFSNVNASSTSFLAPPYDLTAYTSELTCGHIVNKLTSQYFTEEGIYIGEVSSGAVIDTAVFNYIKPSDIMNRLCEQSGYIWQINPNKSLDFKPHDSDTFTFSIGASEMQYGSIQYNEGSPKYRNVQYVVGGMELTSTQTETEVGDGKKQAFLVKYPIMQAPTVGVIGLLATTSTGVTKTVGIRGVDSTYQWYWNKFDNSITQQTSDTAMTTSQGLRVEYIGGYGAVARSENTTAISLLKSNEGGSGVVEDAVFNASDSVYTDNEILSNALVTKYSVICDTLKFRTLHSGISPGSILKVSIPDFQLSSAEFLVDSVNMRDVDGQFILYDIVGLSGYDHGGWSEFFDSLLTRTVEKNIWEGAAMGDILEVGAPLTQTHGWGQVVSATSYTCLTPSDTLYAQTTNYPC